MATYTANHLLVTTHLECMSGPWIGEEAVWTLRFCNGRTSLESGEFTLNTFDVHTDVHSRAVTYDSVPGQITQLWTGDNAPPQEEIRDGDIDDLLGPVVKFFNVAKAYILNNFKLDSVKVYAVGLDGKAPSGPQEWKPTTPVAGAAAAETGPEQAVCISLYTANRSKHGRGRIYVGPAANTVFSTTGVLFSSPITALVNGMKALQDNVRTIGSFGTEFTTNGIIWNRTDKSKASTINLVRVGDEIDHQERRTKSRPETFTNALVA